MATAENPSAPTPDSVTGKPAPAAGTDSGTGPAAQGAPPGAVQTTPDAPIPLPPPKPRPGPSPEVLLRRFRRLDGALVAVVLAFAFLVASFPARNTDLFQHLATGRLIAQGGFAFGADPFTFTAQGVWVNHAWLYDLLVYLIYYCIPGVGGAALVVLKALLVVGLAELMLRSARPAGRPLWVPAACVGLAVLSLSPRLLLQPAVVSYFFLALTLWLLSSGRGAGIRRWWLIPAVCLLWVNFDGWFLLGPLCVLLFLAGEALQRHFGPEPAGLGLGDEAGREEGRGRLRALALVLAASLAACVVNPYHVRAFALPPELGLDAASSTLSKEPQFRGQFVSPWEGVYFGRSFGLSAAGLAYYPLALLGLVSFGLTSGAWHWWRVLFWLSLLALSSVNSRLVPYFAVVAGPIAALNFLDFAALRLRAGGKDAPEAARVVSGWRWLLAGRVGTVLLGVALLAVTVPGWTQAEPHYARRLGWEVQVDPSLRSAAEQIRDWRERGLVPEGTHWFNLAPEVSNYLAWFCPGERCFLDYRLPLFRGAADDYVRVRQALHEGPNRSVPGDPGPPAWREVFGERKLRFLVFNAPDLSRGATSLARLHSDPDEWVPLHVNGRAAIFAWKGAEVGEGSSAPPALDFEQQAFGPGAEKAPAERARPPGSLPWWKALLEPPPPPSVDAGSAAQHLIRFESLQPRYGLRQRTAWQLRLAAQVVGSAGLRGGPLLNGAMGPARLSFACWVLHDSRVVAPEGRLPPADQHALGLLERYLQLRDAGPPSSLYLALRSARRALVHNPDDAGSYLVLAQTYSSLANRTRERSRALGPLPHTRAIRQSQVAAALNGVLALNPPDEVARRAHELLAETYNHPEFFEPQLKHFKEYLRLTKALGHLPGVSPQQYPEALGRLEKFVKDKDQAPKVGLRDRLNQYVVNAADKPVLQKAEIARRFGLAETALNLLLKAWETDPQELRDKRNPGEAPGATAAVQMLLALGRLEKAREGLDQKAPDGTTDRRLFGTVWLDPGDERDPQRLADARGLPGYEWLRAQLAAASGEYADADKYLAEAQARGAVTPAGALALAELDVLPRSGAGWKGGGDAVLVGVLVGQTLLREAPQAARMPWQLQRHLPLQLQQPFRPRQPGVLPEVLQANAISVGLRHYEADLWALRSWLALEAGDMARAREQALAALEAATSRGAGGRPTHLPFRSRPLAGLCLELAERGRKPGP